MNLKAQAFLAQYLLREIWRGWKETPLNPLAKSCVAGVLTAIASVILISFHLSEVEMNKRLQRLGANTIIIREFLSTGEGSGAQHALASHFANHPEWAVHVVRAVPVAARTELGHQPKVFVPHHRSPLLPGASAPSASRPVLYAVGVPAGIRSQAWIDGIGTRIETGTWEAWMDRLGVPSVLLLPAEAVSLEVLRSAETISVLQAVGANADIEKAVRSLRTLARMENRGHTNIHDPLSLQRDIQQLRHHQTLWRWGILLGLGSAMALILSVIALLEFRQWEYMAALLKSLGAGIPSIYLRYLLESVFIIFGAAAFSIVLINQLALVIFPSLGIPQLTAETFDLSGFLASEGAVLAAFLGAGIGAGSIPVAVLLRKPVGIVLG